MSHLEPESVKQVYDRWHDQRTSTDDLPGDLMNPWNRFVCANIGDVANRLVLEIACGRGQLTSFLLASGARVMAADLSSRALRITGDRFYQSERPPVLLNADACRIPLADMSVDVVVSCETIEHVPSPSQALQEFHRVLKPRGRLILTFPSHLNLTGLYRLYLWVLGRPYNSGVAIQPIEQPLVAYRVMAALRRIGFRVLSTDGMAHYVPWPGRPPKRVEWIEHTRLVRTLLKPFALHFGLIAERV